MLTFAERASCFFSNLEIPTNLPGKISVMNPYDNEITKRLVEEFLKKFYGDYNKRIFIAGINPGRFGGGVTGISFTDPVNLEVKCDISNNLDKKPELSSKFVYSLIDEFGGSEIFYSRFFISAVYPLALIKDGKNYNYYNTQRIYRLLKPQILKTFRQQIELGARDNVIISFGKKNAEYIEDINNELRFFKEIVIFDHPRFIMQYRLKKLDFYLDEYTQTLRKVSKV